MKILNTKMRFQAVMMTPEFAQALLDKNHPHNRKPKKGKIASMRYDMLGEMGGVWYLTPDPVAVDEDGYTINGQNRLTACVQAGVEVPMVLVTGVPRTAILGMDCGTNRSVADAAKILGKTLPHGGAGYAAIARRMQKGSAAERLSMTIPQTLAFIESHRKALDFAFGAFGTKPIPGITQAPVLAVIARAYYLRGMKDRVKEFAEVLKTGLPSNPRKDGAAIQLRNWLLTKLVGGRKRTRLSPGATQIYAKTESALMHFLDENNPDKLYGTREELFPIPEDGVEKEEADVA